MKNQKIIALILAMAMIMAVAAGCNAGSEDKKTPEDAAQAQTTTAETEITTEEKTEEAATEQTTTKKNSPTQTTKQTAKFPKPILNEVPIINVPDGIITSYASGESFNMREVLENSYVFKGTIIGMKEYHITWIDFKGRERTLMDNITILDVKINKEYNGKIPMKGDIIKIYYPLPVSVIFEYSVRIREKEEYLFISEILNERWMKSREYLNYFDGEYDPLPDPREWADVSICSGRSDIFPVEDNQIIIGRGYFDHNKEIMDSVSKKIIPYEQVNKTNNLTTPEESLKSGAFIALDEKDFAYEFKKLFENTSILPTGS